jgi:hypothetical protein
MYLLIDPMSKSARRFLRPDFLLPVVAIERLDHSREKPCRRQSTNTQLSHQKIASSIGCGGDSVRPSSERMIREPQTL